MRPNHLTAIIGVILLLIAGAGLGAIEEKPQATNTGAQKFHVSFPLSNSSKSTTAAVIDGTTATASITLDQLNVTLVALMVKWTDNAPMFTPAAAVTVQMSDPNGTQVGSGRGTDGSTGFVILAGPQNVVPAEYNISASSEARAWQKVLDANPPMVNGTGDWKMTVSVTRSGFHPLRKGSVSVILELVFPYYKADVKLVEATK